MPRPMTLPALAYRAETGVRRRLSRRALDRGWTPAVLPYPGYGGHGRVRVLGRVVLAPAGTDPASRRGVPGWQRLLTLELPDVDVDVAVAGQRTTVRSDEAGLVDVTLLSSPAAGPVEATLSAGGRSAAAVLHVAADSARLGVVCDIDDTVWVTGLHHPLRAAWRTLARSSGGRRAVPGMSNLLNGVAALDPGAPEMYAAFAEQHPGRVAAIGLRQVQPAPEPAPVTQPDGVPVRRAVDGDRLLELLLPDLAESADRPGRS